MMDFLFLINQVFTNNTEVQVLSNANYIMEKMRLLMNWQRRLQRKLQWGLEANHRYLPTLCECEDKEECLPETFSQVVRAR